MLAIYARLFNDFATANVEYSVFKGLDHLSEDLIDARGDVDIWVAARDLKSVIALARAAGFFTVRWSYTWSVAFVMIGWDIPTGRKVMIHLHRAPIALRKRSLALLVFVYQTAPTETQLDSIPVLVSDAWFRQYEASRAVLDGSSTAALLRLVLVRRLRLRELGFRFSLDQTLATYLSYVHRFVLLGGKFRISGRGLIVTFIGIDGSGKSSMVDHFQRSDFLKSIAGVRGIYFGNHAFWIPGLATAVRRYRGPGTLGVIVMALSVFDRKLRVLPALWAWGNGRVVLCDRYFYDQKIGDPTQKYLRNRALRAIINPIVRWIPAQPDASFYLRVRPAIAHARKPGGNLDQAIATASAYDALAAERNDITIVDADESFEAVVRAVRGAIVGCLRVIAPRVAP